MRIALVAPFGLRSKGTTRARVLPLGRALARRGHTVALFVPPYDCPEDAGRRWSDGGVDVINLPLSAVGRNSAAWQILLSWRLWRAAVTWRPDRIHVFKSKGPSGLAGAVFYLAQHAPLRSAFVASSRLVIDADDWEGNGGWNDDLRAGYTPLQRRFFAWQERFGLSHADAWTVASKCLRDRAVAFGADPSRVFLLPNASDQPSALRSPTFNARTDAVLYTRFAGVRPADVLALWARVRMRRPAARLTVAGCGLAGEERQLLGQPGIDVLGWVEPIDLAAILARSCLAVVPWADTPANRARSSVKVRELMAAGLPIVAFAVGELPDVLGETGLLVPSGDLDAFAAAVIHLLDEPLHAALLGQAARTRGAARFDWDVLADVALSAYDALSG